MTEGLFSVITTVVSAGLGAWIAATVAAGRWRAETTGRRKAELAEEVLADFYKMRTEVRYARIVHALLREAEAQEGYEASVRRQLQEVLAKRYRFEAVFGREAAEPFAVLAAFGQATFDSGTAGPEMGDLDAAVIRMEDICRKAILGNHP